MANHEGLHEPVERLSIETQDSHRAIVSMMEELEAVDWYKQRADATTDPALRGLLLHNMEEEIEHFCMLLEYMRRRVPQFDEAMRTYLFKQGDILQLEHTATEGPGGAAAEGGIPNARLTVGQLINRSSV